MKYNVFTTKTTKQLIERINKLTVNSSAKWGIMSVEKMLAHCNVSYEMIYTNNHKKPNVFLKFILKNLIKNKVCSDKAYKKNGRTAPQFIISDSKNLNDEKKRLLDYIIKTQELGEEYFNNKESHSFGKLTTEEWNNMFYKHLDHHLSQFNV